MITFLKNNCKRKISKKDVYFEGLKAISKFHFFLRTRAYLFIFLFLETFYVSLSGSMQRCKFYFHYLDNRQSVILIFHHVYFRPDASERGERRG